MSSLINPGTLKAATYAAKQWYDSQDETCQLITRRSCIGGGLALIPYPIVGEAACFVNQIAMYRGITKSAGVRFSEKVLLNVGKFLVSQAAGLVGGVAATFGISAAVKFVPGLNFLAGFAEAPAVAIANYVCGVVYYKMLGNYISNGGSMDASDEEIVQGMCSYPIAKEDIAEAKQQAQIALKGVNYLEFKTEAQACIDEVKEHKDDVPVVVSASEVQQEGCKGEKMSDREEVMIDTTKPESLDDVKARLRGVIGAMAKLPGKYGAVAPSPSLIGARELLGLSDYEVVVCGEAKQGKSSFINALLGDASLLPVDTAVTTSQVFRIGNAEHESFYLVFEDGTRIKIDRAELSRYGKQSDKDIEDEPLFMGRKLKWIEVNVPSPNLPKGLHILDTPGLGSLYAKHAEIAMRYLTNPDAVIFVTDTNAPITESEMKMVEAIFSVTDNVLFVLSKSDALRPAQVASLCSNCDDVLNKAFAEKIGRRIRMWPVSSNRYLSSNPKMVAASGFTEMFAGLQNLFERTSGLTCSQMAYTEALTYYNRVSQFRRERLNGIDSPYERETQITIKTESLRKTKEKWSASGNGRKEFERRVCEVMSSCRRDLNNVFPAIQRMFENRVNELRALGQVRKFEENLPSDIAREIKEQTNTITKKAVEKLAGLVAEVQNDIQVPIVNTEGLQPLGRCNWTVGLGAAAGSALHAAFNTSIILTGLATIGGITTEAITAGHVLAATVALASNPVGWALAGILLFSAGCTYVAARQRSLANAQQVLKNNVQMIVNRIQTQMMGYSIDPLSFPVEKWLRETEDAAISGAATFADREIKRLEEDIRQLKEDAEASDKQREAAKSQMTDMGKTLEQLQTCMNNVHEFLEGYANDSSKSF